MIIPGILEVSIGSSQYFFLILEEVE